MRVNVARVLGIAVVVSGLSVAGWAFFQVGTPAQVVFHKKMWAYTALPGATIQDRDTFHHNLAFGGPLPSTMVLNSDQGAVKGTLTGLVLNPSGERQLTVTLIDDSNDVQIARVYLSGALVATATRQNGGIVDRAGKAIATLSVFIPPAGLNYSVQVGWDSSGGHTRNETVTTNQ